MGRRSASLYGNSPTSGRDEETGKVVVKKAEKAEVLPKVAGGAEGGKGDLPMEARHAGERREMHHRHAAEHMAMHMRHETEHAHAKGDKAAMHRRHETEYKDMGKRHSDEMKILHGKQEKEAFAGGAADAVAPSKEEK